MEPGRKLDMKMEFLEGTIPEQKVFHNLVFPKTLFPPNEGKWTAEMLAELVREKKEWLSKEFDRYSAILFRGFNVESGEEMESVVEAFGWENMVYLGLVSRNKIYGDRVFTANDAPVDKFISFHHEMSTIKEFPSKIFFYCQQPSPKGGETSILPADIVLKKMEETLPEIVSKLQTLGYIFQTKSAREDEKTNVISKTWKWLFKTEDKLEAELRAKETLGCTSVRFNEDGSAVFVYGPLDPIKQFVEKRVWFHHLVGRNEGDTDSYFGDGTPIPRTALDTYRKIMFESCVDIKWQKGDVLLVDNLSVQHARRTGEEPRQIFVSICK